MRGQIRAWVAPCLAALFAAGHDGGVKPVAEVLRHLVNLVAAVNLNGLAGGVEDDLAMAAFLEVLFDFRAGLRSNRVVNQIVEDGKKLGAGHDAASSTEGIRLGSRAFMAVVRPNLISRVSFLWRPTLLAPLSF